MVGIVYFQSSVEKCDRHVKDRWKPRSENRGFNENLIVILISLRFQLGLAVVYWDAHGACIETLKDINYRSELCVERLDNANTNSVHERGKCEARKRRYA